MRIISSLPAAIAAAVVFALIPSRAWAQTFGGVGERAQGMGGAFVAIADDATAVYWNPAGIGSVFKFDTQLGITSPPQTADNTDGAKTMFVGAALPVLGFAYYRTRSAGEPSGSRQLEGSRGVDVSTFGTGHTAVTLVQSIVSQIVVGSTLRVSNGAGQTGFDLDVGAKAVVGDVRLGFVSRNLTQALDTSRQARIGVGFAPRSLPAGVFGPLSIDVDVDLTRTPTVLGDRRLAAIGSEQWWLRGTLGTRVGVNWNTYGDEEDPAVSGGLTVKIPSDALGGVFIEGHLIRGRRDLDSDWGAGLRISF